MRNRFDEQLLALNNRLIEMGGHIEANIAMAISALNERSQPLAEKAIAADQDIDHLEKEIESLCLKLLLQQQPVARDLRTISAALKMITDMERIGDQAADIAEITLHLLENPQVTLPEHIHKMATATVSMVTQAIDAFVRKDVGLANQVIAYDDVVDGLFTQFKTVLIVSLQENGAYGEQALDLLMIGKYFERIGDHATNIAEWVVFSLTGIHKDEKVM